MTFWSRHQGPPDSTILSAQTTTTGTRPCARTASRCRWSQPTTRFCPSCETWCSTSFREPAQFKALAQVTTPSPTAPRRSAIAVPPSALWATSASAGGGETLVAFLGGVRVTPLLRRRPRLRPFGQVLAEYCPSGCGSPFALQPGFGVEYVITSRIGVLGQLDFRLFPAAAYAESELHFSGGVTIGLGR